MSYKVEGNAASLEDIRRDIAFLQELELKATNIYDRYLLWDEVNIIVKSYGYNNGVASRITNGVRNFNGFDDTTGIDEKGAYLGALCDPRLTARSGLLVLTGFNTKTMEVFCRFLKDLGVEAGVRPEKWRPPAPR